MSVGDVITADAWNGLAQGEVSSAFLSNADYSSVADAASITFTAESGRVYLVSASIKATQITATGTPTVKLLIAGVEQSRLVTGVSFTASSTVYGSSMARIVGAGASVTVKVTAQDSAGALRIAASDPACLLAIVDLGI